MIRSALRSLIGAAILLSPLACSAGTMGTVNDKNADPRSGKDQKVALTAYESTFDPRTYEEDIEAIKKSPVAEQIQNEEKTEGDTVIVEEEVLQGFRIQIFATSGIDEANFLKAMAAQRVPEDSIYIVYDQPVYKVRLGDFLTRYQANLRLPSVIGKGFTDAWVVADRVIQRKFVKVSRADLEKPKE